MGSTRFSSGVWNFRSWWCSLDNPIGRGTRPELPPGHEPFGFSKSVYM